MNKNFLHLTSCIAYVVFSALLAVYGQPALKPIVSFVGITLSLLSVAVVVMGGKNSDFSVIFCLLLGLGIIITLFSQFFVSVSLFLCGLALATYGVISLTQHNDICSVGEIAVGIGLILATLFFRRFFLFVTAILMLLCAILRLLTLLGAINS